ncbi:MAG: peptide chain release factor N(5)-glutamine methyltransferase, partial [Chloroflexi bacterium]|nr:peptide chain release factor N(5)-glutamine methyltransferase [Chloroflexota bacterium]
ILAHPETNLSALQLASVEESISRLEAGTPLPYILGHWGFFDLDLIVTPDVLIPRPETELLVEKAIVWLQASPERRTIADVGTGTGCIAVSIAVHVPDAHILATDLSRAALEVARRNALKYQLEHKIDFVECDILPVHIEPLPTERHFDLICANLPYIPTEKLHSLPAYGREPVLALDGCPDGLDPFRKLFRLAPDWLAPGGRMLLEIEATLGTSILSLAYDIFTEAEMHLHQDLAGRDRLLEIQLPA